MINSSLRPWGKPQWLLQMEKLRNIQWLLIGSLSTQDRCLAMLEHKDVSYNLAHVAFLEIIDRQSVFHVRSESRREFNKYKLYRNINGYSSEILRYDLLEPLLRLKKQVAIWTNGPFKKNIIFDISCLPERYFFPMLRWFLAAENVENLIITCMAPGKYTQEELAYDPQDWAHIQTFALNEDNDQKPKSVIVGAGFLPFGLPGWLKQDYSAKGIQVSMLFPFPAPPANIKRSWEFVRQVEVAFPINNQDRLARVSANDMPGCFDRIGRMTGGGETGIIFAPFGPKAHSVAMCLQAINTGGQVLYTQPAYYHPDYTTGIKMEDGLPAGLAYAIRVNGNTFY